MIGMTDKGNIMGVSKRIIGSDRISSEIVGKRIFIIRGQKVMIDFHLAELYGVPTKSLNLAVKRNLFRFSDDFMFKLTQDEHSRLQTDLRFQIETSKKHRGGRRYTPCVFTEQGVAMLSSVLRSRKAVLVNIAIMRAFVQLRMLLSTHKDLDIRLKELEQKSEQHDGQLQAIFEALRQLMVPPAPEKKKIGFRVEDRKAVYSPSRTRELQTK
jgi:hypothetical protein